MKAQRNVFVAITNPLIVKLHLLRKEYGLSEDDLYFRVNDLIDIPCITALSKYEAFSIIGTLSKQNGKCRPLPPPLENEVDGDATALPSYWHVKSIRAMFRELGWEKEKIKRWLVKYGHVDGFRTMNRQQAQKIYYVLKKIIENQQRENVIS